MFKLFKRRPRRPRRRNDILLEALEDRVLFDAVPDATLNLPAEEMINESFDFSVDFDNTSPTSGGPNDIGYGPYVDLHVPQGVDVNTATYLGSPVNLIQAGEFNLSGDLVQVGSGEPGTPVNHPLLGTAVSGGTPGDFLYVIELPFGSFVPDQPVATIDINATLDKADGATVGTPLNLVAQGGFRYGFDPLDNPGTDPPVSGPTSAAAITPTVINLDKTSNAAEDETATGSNFPVTYTLTVDVADGETVSNLDIADYLENTLEYISASLSIDDTAATASSGPTIVDQPVTPGPQNAPDNDLLIRFTSITGSSADNDIVVTYQAFTPQQDANSAEIIDPTTGDDQIGLNESSVSGTYDSSPVSQGTDSPTGVYDADGTDYQLNQRSIAIQKGVSIVNDLGAAGASPGDTLEYTLSFQVSDYFSFDQIVIDDTFSDGQLWDGTFTPTFAVTENGNPSAGSINAANYTVDRNDGPAEDGTTDVQFRISDELVTRALDDALDGDFYNGDPTQDGGTIATVTFRTVIQDVFTHTFPSGDPSVDMGDRLTNDVTIDGRVRDAALPPASWVNEADTSSASVDIVGATLVKSIYAIEGDTSFSIDQIQPGEVITYRLQLTLPVADVENLELNDFLPLPVLDATELTTLSTVTPPNAIVPSAGTAKYGSNHTLHTVVPSVTPTMTTDAAANSVTFDFGTFDDPGSQSAVIDILFSVTASNQPFADGLFLTNQAQATYGTTFVESTESNAIVPVTLRTPELTMTKGIVSTDATSPTFNPTPVGPVTFEQPGSTNPAFTDPINSTNLAANPIDSDQIGGDAGDLVKYALVIENTGGADAYDVVVNDVIPTGLQIPTNATGLNLEIRDGDGNLMSWTGVDTGSDTDIFGGGVSVYDPIRVYLASDTTNSLTVMPSRDNFDVATNEQVVGPFGVSNIEALARHPSNGNLYGTNDATFGSINLGTGAFTAIGGGLGSVNGSLGNITLTDIDGLTFNPITGDLYGSQHRTGSDIIFKINVATGVAIADAFGVGNDYIAVDTDGAGVGSTIDDIAIDKSGHMYATMADRLIRIDLDEQAATSTIVDIGLFGPSITDMEGLSADDNGQLWGTTGNTGGLTDRLWEVSKTTGAATNPRQLDDGGDYEGSEAYFPGAPGSVNDYEDAQSGSNGSNILIITYDLELTTAVEPGLTYTNDAELVSFSGSDNGTDYTAGNTGSWNDTADVTTVQPSVAKTRLGTSITNANNAADEAVIGELIQYEVTVTLPEGTIEGSEVYDRLDNGLTFVQIDSIAASGGLSSTIGDMNNPGDWALFNPSVTIDGSSRELLTFDFGDVVNTDTNNGVAETITLTYSVRLENDAVNQSTANEAGGQRNNRARFRWDTDGNGTFDMQTSNVSAQNTSIIEPVLQVNNTLTLPAGATGDAGDAVRYTITLQHDGALSETDAFDVTFSDPVPSEISYSFPADVTVIHSTLGDISGIFEVVGGELRTQAGQGFDMQMGETVVITIDGTLTTAVEPGESIDNTATIKWTSLNDNEESGGSSDERDGEGTTDDYTASGAAGTLTIDDPSVSKSLVSTSINNLNNSNTEAVIGETAVFEVRITIPEGTTNASELIDAMEEGLQFVSLDSIVAPAGVSTSIGVGDFSDTASFTPATSGDGITVPQTLTFDLGNITNTNSDVAPEEVVLRYTVRIANSTDAGTGGGEDASLVNSAHFEWTRTAEPTDTTSSASATAIDVIEPDLNVSKTAEVNPPSGSTQGDAGDTVRYTVSIAHDGASPTDAFDVTFSDLISDRISYNIGDVTATHSTAGDITGLFEVLVDGTLQTQAGVSFDMLVGETVTIVVDGTLTTAVQPNEQIDNDATIKWTSLNDDEVSGSGTSAERDGESGVGVAPDDYTETSNTASITIIQPTVTKDFLSTSVVSANNLNSEAVIGELVTYRLRVDLPEGTTNTAEFVDTLDLGLAFDSISTSSASVGVTSSRGDLNLPANIGVSTVGDGTSSQQTITFDLGDLTNPADGDSETIEVVYVVRVTNATGNQGNGAAVGTLLNNSALFQWDSPSGGTDQTLPDTATDVEVIEPELDIASSVEVNPPSGLTTGDGSDPIRFTSVISHLPSSDTDAFDLTFADTVPADVVYNIGDVTVTHSTAGDITSSFEVVGGVLQTQAGQSFDLLQGETVTVVIDGTTATTVESGESIANAATTKWTSLNDDEISGSGTSLERDGEDGAAGSPDNYEVADAATATIDSPVVAKSLISTSVVDVNNANNEVAIGETVVYRITVDIPEGVTNAAQLIDNLDLGLEFISLDSISAPVNVTSDTVDLNDEATVGIATTGDGFTVPQQITFSLGNITNSNASGATEQIVLDFTARVTNIAGNTGNGAGVGTLLDGTVRLDWNVSDEGAMSSNTADPADIEVIEPLLNVAKVIDDDTPNLGQTVTYTLTLTHTAATDTDAHDIRVQDLVPADMTLQLGTINVVGATIDNDSSAGNNLDLTLDRLNVGGTITVTYDAIVSSNPAIIGSTQNNTADIEWTSLAGTVAAERDGSDGAAGSPNNYADSASETATVVSADLSLTKDDGLTNVTPGQTYSYAITVSNSAGPSSDTATGVTVTDTLDLTLLSFVSTDDPANVTFDGGTGLLTWDAQTIGVGANKTLNVTVQVNDPVPAGASVVFNEATVTHDDPEPTPADNTNSDTDTLDATPDMTLAKTDGGITTTPGGTVIYTLDYQNVGNQHATGVVITETLPTGSSFDAGSSTAGWTTGDGITYTITIGNVNAGAASASVDFAVTVDVPVAAALEQLTNNASIADDGTNGADPTPGNNAANDTTPIDAAPDLTVTKDDGGITTTAGGTVVYTIDYQNVGTQNASGVILTETLPTGSTFDAGSSTPGWVDGGGGTYTFTVGGVAVSGSGSVDFAVTVDNPVAAGQDDLLNAVSIADDGLSGADLTPGDNSDTDTTPINAAPDLIVTKDDGGISTTPSGTVVYTLSYQNAGTQDATGVVITETLPTNSTFNAGSSTPGWVDAGGGNYTFAIGALAVGGSGNVDFAVTVDATLPPGKEQLDNTTTIADDGTNGPDETPGDNTGIDSTPINATPDLVVTKDDGGITANPGDTVSYTINYQNVGPQDASNVTLTETVPAGSSFNAVASSPGWISLGGGVFELSLGTVVSSGSGAVTFAVDVDDPVAAAREQIDNTVSIADDGIGGADPTPGNNSDNDSTPIDALPDLVVTKTDGGISANTTDTVVYTLSYSNVGDQDAQNVVVTETLPANTTYNAASSTPGWVDAGGGTYTFSLPLVASGIGGTIDFAVTVASSLPAGVDDTTNAASIADDGTGGADPTPGDNSDTDDTPLIAAPDLAVTKTDGGISATTSDTVIYTLSYSNNGTQDATGVVITETLPTGSSFNAGSSTPGWVDAGGGNYTFTIGALAVGGSGNVDFAVTVDDPIAAGIDQLNNTSVIADDGTNGADEDPSDNTGPDTTSINAEPDLYVTKDDGGVTVNAGDTVVYTLSYGNNGNQGATGVVITETVPTGSTFNAGSSTPGWVDAGGGNYTFAVGGLAGGASSTVDFAVTVDDPLAAAIDQLNNTTSITDDGTNGPDPTPGDNTGVDSTPINAAPDLVISKDDGGITTTPGGSVVYTISYQNVGTQDATGVVITETLPAGSTFDAVTSTPGWVDAGGGSYTFAIGALASGGSGTVDFAVTTDIPVDAAREQLINNTSIADDGTNGADENPADNAGSDTTPIDAAPDLTVTKDDGGITTIAGGTVVYTIDYQNVGTQNASGVVLTETLPANSTFNAASSTPGWVDAGGGTYTFAIGNLIVGGSGSVAFAVTADNPLPPAVDQLDNTVSVADDGLGGADLTPADNTALDDTPITAAPDLSVTKTDGGATANAGDTVVYTLTYDNTGTQDATGVVITETLPTGTSFNAASSTPGWVDAGGGTYTFAVGNLNSGDSGNVDFAVTVDNPLAAGIDDVINTTSITDDGTNGPDEDPTDNTDGDNTPVNAAPNLYVTKDDGGVTVNAGDTVTYTLTYGNIGTQDATGAVITETVPTGSTFNAAASTPGWVDLGGGVYSFTIGNLNSGGSGTVDFAVTVDDPLAAAIDQLNNTTSITDDGTNGADEDPLDNSGNDTTPVTAAPDLVITKTDGDITTTPGGTVVYTINYQNVGTQDATGVVISETLPAGSTYDALSSTPGWVDAGGGTYTFAIGALDSGNGGTVDFAVTVDIPVAAAREQLLNNVSIGDDGANGPDETPGDNSASDTTPIDAAPDLAVTKTDGGITSTAGGTVVYTLSYQNVGTQNASGVVLTETLPSDTSFNAAASTPGWTTLDGITYTFSLGTVAVAGSGTVDFAVTVDNPLPPGVDDVNNLVSIADDGLGGADLNPLDNSDTDDTPVDAFPDLYVTKTDGGITTAPSGSVVYTLSYGNLGDQGATGVVITETLPAGSMFDPVASTPGWSTSDGITYTINVGTILATGTGTVDFAVFVDDPIAAGIAQLNNSATIADDGTNGADLDPSDNTGIDDTPVTAQPDYTVTIDDGILNASPGDPLTYTLNVANVGNQDGTGVVVSDTFPANILGDVIASNGGIVDPIGGTITWNLGNLDAGDSIVLTVTAQVRDTVPAGVIQFTHDTNVTDDGSNGADPTPANNLDADTDNLIAAPDYTITKDDALSSASPGDSITYTISVANVGNQDGTGVTVADTFPPSILENVVASNGGIVDPVAGTIDWNLGALLATETINLTVTADVRAAVPAGVDNFTNTATVTDDGTNGPDATPGDNTDDDTDILDATPDYRVTIDDGESFVNEGDPLTYIVTVDNAGDQDGTGVVVTQSFPTAVLENVVASDGGIVDVAAGTITWNVGNLASGAGRSFTVTTDIRNPVVPPVNSFTNDATVTDDGTNGADPTPANNFDDDVDILGIAPDLTVTIDDGLTNLPASSTVTYNITARNIGNADANGVVLVDTFDPAVFTGMTPSGGGIVDMVAGTITWNLGTVAFGQTINLTVDADTAASVPAGLEDTTHTVTISDDGAKGPDPTPSNNTDDDTDLLDRAPDYTATIDDGLTNIAPGQSTTYILSIDNVGSQDGTGVIVTQTFDPAELENVVPSAGGIVDTVAGTITWNVGNLNAGNNVVLSVDADVRSTLPLGTTQITTGVSVTDDGANGPDPTPANNSDDDTDNLPVAVDYRITIDDGVSVADSGDMLTYTITIENVGNTNGTGVDIDTTFDNTALTNVMASDAGIVNAGAGTIHWDIGGLAIGASRTVTVTADVITPLPPTMTLFTTDALVSDDGLNGVDPTPANNLAADTDLVATAPDYSITIDDGLVNAAPGDTIVWTVDFANVGNVDGTGVVVTDTFPPQVLENVVASNGGVVDIVAGTITWNVGNLAKGTTTQYTVTAKVRDAVPAGFNDFTHNASIADDGLNGADPTPANNSDNDTDTLNATPDYVVAKDDGLISFVPGQTTTYTIQVTNGGNQDGTGVVLTDTFPPTALTGVVASGGGVVDPVAGTITWNLGNLAVNASQTVTVTATVVNPAPAGFPGITNTAMVTDDGTNGPDPNTSDNSDSDTNSLNAVPNYAINKTDDLTGDATPGQTYNYFLTVTNNGDQNGTNIVVTDNLPINVINAASVVTDDPANVTYSAITGLLTWNVSALAGGGASRTLTVTVTVQDPVAAGIENYSNTASVVDDFSNGPDPDPSDNTSTDPDVVAATPDYVIVKTDNLTEAAMPGDPIRYSIQVTNVGGQDGTNVVVTDNIPLDYLDGASVVTDDPANVTYDPVTGALNWSVGNLAGRGGTRTLLVDVNILDFVEDVTAETIPNTAVVTDDLANGPDPTPANNTSTVESPLLVFAFDSFNNFKSPFRNLEDEQPLGMLPVRGDELTNTISPPPVDPVFSGLAEPGSTLKIRIYDEHNIEIAERQIVADTAGNWLATFPGTLIYRHPHHMTVEQTASVQGSTDDAGFNLRRYFHPSMHHSLFMTERMTVASIVRDTPTTVLTSIHEANNNPLSFGWSTNAYEAAASSTNAARM